MFEHFYDGIWLKWCAGFAEDEVLVSFLEQAKAHLSQNGFIFLFDNVVNKNKEGRKEDQLVRCLSSFRRIIALAHLTIVHQSTPAPLKTESGRYDDVVMFCLN